VLGGPWRSGWSSGDDPPDPADPTGTSAVIGPDPATNPARAPQPSADERTGDPATLAAATQALRQHVDDRWVEMSDRVLSKALAATRRSLPVRAHDLGGGGALYVSEQVLTAYIRDAIAPMPAAAPTQIHIHADTGHHCTEHHHRDHRPVPRTGNPHRRPDPQPQRNGATNAARTRHAAGHRRHHARPRLRRHHRRPTHRPTPNLTSPVGTARKAGSRQPPTDPAGELPSRLDSRFSGVHKLNQTERAGSRHPWRPATNRWSPGTPLPAPATASNSDLRGNRPETAWNFTDADQQHHLNVATRDPAPETRDKQTTCDRRTRRAAMH